MKLMALTDIHGRTNQIPLLANAVKDCDAVVVAGDITNFGGADQARLALSALAVFQKPILAIPGNCDLPQVETVLKEHGSSLIHNPVEINGIVFVGFSYEASSGAMVLNENTLQITSQKQIALVTHQPAWGTAVDLQASTQHKGSRSVRKFIEDYQPLFAVSGHIHEARGTDQIGSTLLVNPGPFRNGCYGVVDIGEESVRAKLHCL